MPFRLGPDDEIAFSWLCSALAVTARQLSVGVGRPESSMRRRLGQYVRAGIAASSPPIAGFGGHPEREYYITTANLRKLSRLAPWITVSATRRWKQSAVPHRRLINEFWVSLEAAFRRQGCYSYRLFPHYHYDPADAEAPTCIRGPNRRRRTPSDTTVAADFALVVSDPSGKSSLLYGEIDTGEETVASTLRTRPTIQTKLEAYGAFHDVGGYRRIEDTLAAKFSGFRVLVVTKSKRRTANIRRLCAALGSSDFIWFTGVDRITPRTILGPIWQTGEDQNLRRLLRHCGTAAVEED